MNFHYFPIPIRASGYIHERPPINWSDKQAFFYVAGVWYSLLLTCHWTTWLHWLACSCLSCVIKVGAVVLLWVIFTCHTLSCCCEYLVEQHWLKMFTFIHFIYQQYSTYCVSHETLDRHIVLLDRLVNKWPATWLTLWLIVCKTGLHWVYRGKWMT